MRNTILKIIVSVIAFGITLAASGYLMNRGNVNTTKEMEAAILPVVYMNVGGTTVNELYGYTQDMEASSVKKKFKDKHFAAGCSRDVIRTGAERLGWELDVLFEKTILAMRDCEEAVRAAMYE